MAHETRIRYVENLGELPAGPITGFCSGWKRPLSSARLRELLERSRYWIAAIDEYGQRVVGIITAISDEVNWAFIPYLEVLPEFRGKGLGRRLVEGMLRRLEHLDCVDLTCDPEKQAFYAKFGMLKSEGMVIRRYLERD